MKGKRQLINLITEMELAASSLETPHGYFPTKGGDGGDDVLWNGLLSAEHYNPGYVQVLHSQASENESRYGMFYRNPLRRSNDNLGHEWYFSRDMSLGVLLAIASYRHTYLEGAASAWISYIHKNRACSIKKPKWLGGGCCLRAPMFRFAPDDDRSNITPLIWDLMGRVWRYKGWEEVRQMKKFRGCDGDINLIEAQVSPLGYQLHLKAVQSYLKFKMDVSKTIRQAVSRICFERQPDNFFYKILSQEGIEQIDIDRYVETCPNPKGFIPRDYWLWEKSTQDVQFSCGWDWVFLGRFILSFL